MSNTEDLFDKELQEVTRGHVSYTDETVPKPETPKGEAKPAKPCTMQSIRGKLKLNSPRVGCFKWALLLVGLSILLMYWQYTGQMQPSAAAPSIYTCALFAGVHLGRAQCKPKHGQRT